MNHDKHLKVNKYLNYIIRSYLTISDQNVKRFYQFILYELETIKYELNVKYGYCLLCDKITCIYNNKNYYSIPWYIMNYYIPCEKCYKYLVYKTNCMNDLIQYFKIR